MTATEMIARCMGLKKNWVTRNSKFTDWYNILKLEDVLEQEGMESVAANDPRTGFNLARHLIVNSIIAHKVEQEDMLPEEVAATSYMEGYVTKRWKEHEDRYGSAGKQGWLWHLVSWLLATGWYSVFSIVEDDKIWSEVWSPAEVFPDFAEEGMIEVAHIYSLSPAAANRKAKRMGWPLRSKIVGNIILYDHWDFDDNGNVANSIVLGTEFAKAPTVDIYLSKVGRLPVFTAPAGGLPDMGSLEVAKWQEHYGESIVATNESLSKNYNKMLSYLQQLMRDTSNPRYLELSSGESQILKAEDIFKRGAIFRGAPGESAGPMQTPAIPIELRQVIMDYQNMLQRGMFPWAVFGNIQQTMSYLAMASVASSSMQILSPYVNAIKGLLTNINNYWKDMILLNGLHPHKFKKPDNLPEEFTFDVQADIEIPGYLVQRATVARMLDPTFRLSTTTVMDRLFPEVKDPLKEQARVRKDDALSHPKAVLADSIIAFREQARLMRESQDNDSADIYEKLAASLEAELEGTQQAPEQPTREPIPEEIAREVLPTREFAAPEGEA